jgi:predicted MFS family arabinose efflux permease
VRPGAPFSFPRPFGARAPGTITEHPVLTVLRLPGAARAFLPSLVGRLALAMAVLAIVLAVRASTGSFAAAGAASGAFGFANVAAAPWRARAIDLWGQRRTLTPLGLAQAASYLGLALAAHAHRAPVAVFMGLSAAAGLAAPPLGAAMRTAWTGITAPGDQRTRALSLDATADEVVFIVGPVVAASLSTAFSPSSALLAAALALLVGTLGLTTSGVSGTLRGRAHEKAGTSGPRPLGRPGFARALVVLFGVGGVLGTVEVVAPAVAVGADHRTASGWLLAALSVGSALGGLVYGHVSWRSALGTRMLFAAAAMGALTGATAFATTVPVFAVGAVAIGLFLAPSVITGYLAAEHLVPPHAATEASVWTNTALNLGAAVANAGAGALVTDAGTTFAMLPAAAVVTAASLCTPRTRLRRADDVVPAPAP